MIIGQVETEGIYSQIPAQSEGILMPQNRLSE
jgi:hypothetical protein